MEHVTALTTLPAMATAKLGQADDPVGLGLAFMILLMVFGVLFMVLLVVGNLRARKGPRPPLERPVLIRPGDQDTYRPTNRGRPQSPRD